MESLTCSIKLETRVNVMYVLLFIEMLAVIVLYLASKNRFQDEISLLDNKKDRLKPVIHIGLSLMELLKHRFCSGYEKRLEIKLRELKGAKNAHAFLKLHIAQKVVLILFALIFATFVGTQIEIDMAYVIFCLILFGALFYATDKQLDDKVKERSRSMQMEFPEFLNKLILLINAGLTVSGAIYKIVKDSRKKTPLHTELIMTINEINSGKTETQSYEEFARRCRIQEVTLFTAVLIQNLRKGNDELVPVLRLQATTCWENRKNIARKLGEEASTKLLVPMIIIFIAILVMIMTPAVLQIQI